MRVPFLSLSFSHSVVQVFIYIIYFCLLFTVFSSICNHVSVGALVLKLRTHMDMLEGLLKYIHSIIVVIIVVVVIVLAINRRNTSTGVQITYIPFASTSG